MAASGISKLDFLAGKEYSMTKFNYWLAKWKESESQADETAGGFSGIYPMFFSSFSPFSGSFLSIYNIPSSLDIIIPGVLYKLYAMASKTCCV